jgi:hypothetical protein
MKSTIFWDVTPYSPLKSSDVSEEHIAFIFRVEEEAEQQTSMKAGGRQSLFFDPEVGGDTLTALYSRREYSSGLSRIPFEILSYRHLFFIH